MKIRTIISAAAALCFVAPAFAQNLDPTVNVTRNYEGKLLEVDKPAMQVNVPDSITHFDLDFGYTVLENHYKGSYQFVPYVLDMKPNPDAYREKRLWIRAGAGYTLHPTFDAVWSPRISDSFRLSVYGTHRSYVGKYRSLNGQLGTADAWYHNKPKDSFGYDLYSRVGASGRYDWLGGCLTFDAAYMDIATSEASFASRTYDRHYDAMDLGARARCVRDDDNYFYWDAGLGIRYGVDNMNGFLPKDMTGFGGQVDEFLFRLRSSLGPVIKYHHAVLVDLEANIATYGKTLESHSGNLAITPKYRYRTDRLNVEAGIRIDMLIKPAETNSIMTTPMNRGVGQLVYPHIAADYAVIEDWLDIYTNIGGGTDPNPYSKMLESRHHFGAAMYANGTPLIDNSIEALSAKLGLRGNLFKRFKYDLSGGWLYNQKAPLDAIRNDLPALDYLSYQCAFASLKYGLETQDVTVDGWIDYKWTNVCKLYEKDPTYLNVVEPSRFHAGVKAEYNWRKRIYAGASLESSINRRIAGNAGLYVPWYLDLGLNFEYRFKNGVSLWAEGGNLLNQTIQREFGYSENGVNFTVGICFTL